MRARLLERSRFVATSRRRRWRAVRPWTYWTLLWGFALAIFVGLVLLDVMLLTSPSWILATVFVVVTVIWGKRAFVDSGFVRFVARLGRSK
jgi:hypothetical protein